MDIGYHGDPGGPAFDDSRISGGGLMGASLGQNHAAQTQNAGQIKAMLQAAAPLKDPSPVERELQQLQANIKQLFGEVDGLSRQLQPVLVPQLEAKNTAQGDQTGVATSPLHRSIYGANVQLTKLAQQVALLRSSLSI